MKKSIRIVRSKIVGLQTQDFNSSLIKEINEKMALSGSVELYDIEAFIVVKEHELVEIKKELVEAEERLSVYCDYQGDSMRFSYNYFFAISEQMSSALTRLKKAMENSGINMDQDVGSFVSELLIVRKEQIDIVDVALIQSPFSILLNKVDSVSMINKRLGFSSENKALKVVVAEKIRLHSMLPKKFLISLKIFFMKFSMAGDIYLMSDNYAVMVEYSGLVNIYPIEEKNFKKLKSIHKRRSRFKLLRSKLLF